MHKIKNSYCVNLFWILMASFLSLPVILYAFCSPSGHQPEDLSLQLWSNMSDENKILSVNNAISSLFVNMLGHGLFLKISVNRLSDISIYKKKTTAINLLMSGNSAIIGAVLAYDAFAWSSKSIQIPFAIAEFLATYTSRFVAFDSLNTFISRYKDIRFTRLMLIDFRFIESGNLIHQYQKDTVHCDLKTIENIFIKMYGGNYHDNKLILEWPICKHFNLYYDLLFAAFFSCVFIPAIYIIFSEKAIRGFALLFNDISDSGLSLPNMNIVLKQALGVIPAASSSIFYLFSVLLFLKSVYCYIISSSKLSLPITLTVMFFANYFASHSMFNVGYGVVNSDNTLGIKPESMMGDLIPYLAMLGVFFANTNACLSFFNTRRASSLDRLTVTRSRLTLFLEQREIPHKIVEDLQKRRYAMVV